MGYTNLYLVPKGPEFVPDRAKIREACEQLDRWHSEDIYCYEGPVWQYVSANPKLHGSFPDALLCPRCKTRLDIGNDEDLDEWQDEAQSTFYSSESQKTVVFHMPCCGAEVVAGDLGLDLPARWSTAYYARFALKLREFSPAIFGDPDVLEATPVTTLEELLGCNLIGFTESGT